MKHVLSIKPFPARALLMSISLALVLGLTSCAPHEARVQELERLSCRMNHRSAEWTQADWNTAAEQLNALIESLGSYSYPAPIQAHIDSVEQVCLGKVQQHVK